MLYYAAVCFTLIVLAALLRFGVFAQYAVRRTEDRLRLSRCGRGRYRAPVLSSAPRRSHGL